MDAATLSNEQLAYVAARTFGKLWMPRCTREALQPFQTFCYELLRSTQIAMPIVMLTLLYVNKFKQRFSGLHGGSGSEYRVFVVALMLASKYLEDNTFTTQTWSEVSHLPAKELTIMQREFLLALDHRLHVPEPEYNAWMNQLQTIVLGGAASTGKSYGITLVSPLVSSDASSPSDFQVVPSPTSAQYHEIPSAELLPSPPAKRTRPAAPSAAYPKYYVPGFGCSSGNGNGLHAVRACTMVEPISIPARSSFAVAPQIYTPPADGVGFVRSEFTFKAPSFSAAPQSGLFYSNSQQQQQQQQNVYSAAFMNQVSAAASIPPVGMISNVVAPVACHAYPAISMVPSASSLGFNQNDRFAILAGGMQQQQQQPQFSNIHLSTIPTSCAASLVNNGNRGFMQQQYPQQPSVSMAAAATAAALAAQYPSMYYNGVSSLGLGSGAQTFPIYTYGA